MLKTEYLGWTLDSIERMDGGYAADYTKRLILNIQDVISGEGKNPEAACAEAQKKIKNHEKKA